MITTASKIALSGKSGAGKSSVARIFFEKYNFKIVKTGLICRQISSILFGDDAKSSTQVLDDALTKIDESIFLKAALRNADLSPPVLIDSLRFANDFHLVKELGFKTMQILASNEDRGKRLSFRGQSFSDSTELHRSETELDNYKHDFVVKNHNSIVDLEEQIGRLFSTI